MYFDERDKLVRAEQFKDWRRKEAERKRQQQMIRSARPVNKVLLRSLANWLGMQMVKWGSKLQQYEPASPPRVASTKSARG